MHMQTILFDIAFPPVWASLAHSRPNWSVKRMAQGSVRPLSFWKKLARQYQLEWTPSQGCVNFDLPCAPDHPDLPDQRLGFLEFGHPDRAQATRIVSHT